MSLRHYLDRGGREVHSHLGVRVFGRFVFFFFSNVCCVGEMRSLSCGLGEIVVVNISS